MCIVALAWQINADIPLLLISNRDEFYARKSSHIHHWQQSPIIAGQDIEAGGTWLGTTAQGKWAIITNFREKPASAAFHSRGLLCQDYLAAHMSPLEFASNIHLHDYAGFNLILGNGHQAVYISNRTHAPFYTQAVPYVLPEGVHLLSNGVLNEPWYKTTTLKQLFIKQLLTKIDMAIDTNHKAFTSSFLDTAINVLQHNERAALSDLPNTGVGIALEELLSSIFIRSAAYGTRCSNILLHHRQHGLFFYEKTHASSLSLSPSPAPLSPAPDSHFIHAHWQLLKT